MPDPFQSYLARVQAIIDESGFAVINIFPDPDKGVPGFAYTVGLSKELGIELMVIGLPHTTAHHAMNEFAKRARKEPLQIGQLYEQVMNLPVRIDKLDAEEAVANMPAHGALHLPRPKQVLRVTWPDPEGRFPGDPEYRYAVTQHLDELKGSRPH